MAQKAKKATFSQKKILIIAAGLLLIVLLAALFYLKLRPNAELIVVAAPSQATLRLDGKKIQNGARGIRAGKHKIELSLEGFETKTQEFEISAGETQSVNLYLVGENEDYSHYLQNEEDIKLLGLIGDETAKQLASEYWEAKSILEILPITLVGDDGESSSRLESGEDCARSYCLKITDQGEALKEKMLERIKSLGFDPDDYEIQYELVD